MKNFSNMKSDFTAGFSVALVALPLSIGIALASGAPASAGLIAAIIGGMLGSWLGGTNVTINGPAAGLIVIVLDAVQQLGNGTAQNGFRGMLAAAVVAGVLQVIFGLFKFARKGLSFPVSIIHGMMCAIGLIIVAKQVHVLLGYAPIAKNPILLYAEIPKAVMNMQPMIFAVGILSLGLLIIWPKINLTLTKKIPGQLIAVILGIGLATFFGLGKSNLLQIPSEISSWFFFPDFSVMTSFAGWKAAITLALVGSLETTLSSAAVDKLDPQARRSDLDRDLIAKGICNICSSMIGGIPMISEIVRSSANVNYGAKTWKANFVHGSIILVAVLVLPSVLSLIPLTSLAAILLLVGGRLGSPKHFHHAFEIGKDNFIGFATTLIVTLGVDLLVGIFAGAAVQYLVEVYEGLKVKNTFHPDFKSTEKNNTIQIVVESSLIFSNFLELSTHIENCSKANKNVSLDLSACEYIDHSAVDHIEELRSLFKSKKLFLSVIVSEEHHPLGHDHLSALKKTG